MFTQKPYKAIIMSIVSSDLFVDSWAQIGELGLIIS